MLFNRIVLTIISIITISRAAVTVACFQLTNETSDTLLDWVSYALMETAYINFSNSSGVRIWNPILVNRVDPLSENSPDSIVLKNSRKWGWDCSILGNFKLQSNDTIKFKLTLITNSNDKLSKKDIVFTADKKLLVSRINSFLKKLLKKKRIPIDDNLKKTLRLFEKADPKSYAVFCRGVGYEIWGDMEMAVSAYVEASDYDQNFLPPLIRLVDIYSRSSRAERYEKYIARLSSPKNMKNVQAVAVMAKYNINKKELKKAENFIKSNQSVLGGNYFGLTQIGNYYIRTGEFQRAISSLTKSVALGVSDLDSYFLLARTYSLAGNYERAIDIFSKLISYRPNYVKYYTLLGETYRKAGKFMEAGAVLQKSVDMAPTNVSALVNVANVYYDLGWYDRAQYLLEKAYKIAPFRDEIPLNLGVVYWHNGAIEKSEYYFKKAMENPKLFIDASNNYANLLFNAGRIKEALKLYKKALKKSGGINTSIIFNMAICYETLGKEKNALKILKDIVNIDPGDEETILKIAQKEFSLTNYGESEIYYRMLRRLNPEDKDVMSALVDVLSKNKNYKEATSIVNDYLKDFPQDIEYSYKLVQLYLDMGWNKVALSQCQNMLGNENFKSNNKTYLLLGKAYYALFLNNDSKDFDKAIYYLKIGSGLSGNKSGLYELMGRIYLNFKGYKDMAADAFGEALKYAYTEDDKMRIRKFIMECKG